MCTHLKTKLLGRSKTLQEVKRSLISGAEVIRMRDSNPYLGNKRAGVRTMSMDKKLYKNRQYQFGVYMKT